MLLDTHYHLDFLPLSERAAFLSAVDAAGGGIVPQTLTPESFRAQQQMPRASLGFHPWAIESREQADRQLRIFQQAVGTTRFIGEVGLDFSPRRLASASQELQSDVFRSIVQTVRQRAEDNGSADTEPYVLSIHAVRSAGVVVDILAQAGVDSHDSSVVPVFHWFSGNSDELTRVMRAGGYISVNPRMLESKKGRAYVRQVPAERLLLETDLPKRQSSEVGEACGAAAADDVMSSLRWTLDRLSELRGSDVTAQIEENQRRLYGM
ncbi:TatD family deoxyribonuclease [Corynebacterium sp. zg254]|uniref:TatD family deoxyribonuclease n=1 Tax=Corynebacterium zhongnanshanii TaxID=2768834 RepID=A0ABQ6VDS8_9CORY|nr:MULTISPECIES: TatD family hydrolase [Corynebacterium]KAB3521007.1 TatD family deoxyribonuclease [Corynebacterium zhongnanshanii]MCR5914647.1 TatD family deoxyribonuclease [Corynebacterium sp. zg254]